MRVDLTSRLTSRPAAAPCSLASSRLRRGSGLASAPQPMIARAIAPGDFLFDLVAGVAGPFGADLVELAPQGRAVAGVTEEHGPDLAGRVGGAQHRHAMIDRSVGLTPKPTQRPSLSTRRLAAKPTRPWPHARLAGARAARASSAAFSIASVSSRV